jgi:hypothetical protein
MAHLAPTSAQPNNKESRPMFVVLYKTLAGVGAKITTPWYRHLSKPTANGAFSNKKCAKLMRTAKMHQVQNVESKHHVKTPAFDLNKFIAFIF